MCGCLVMLRGSTSLQLSFGKGKSSASSFSLISQISIGPPLSKTGQMFRGCIHHSNHDLSQEPFSRLHRQFATSCHCYIPGSIIWDKQSTDSSDIGSYSDGQCRVITQMIPTIHYVNICLCSHLPSVDVASCHTSIGDKTACLVQELAQDVSLASLARVETFLLVSNAVVPTCARLKPFIIWLS